MRHVQLALFALCLIGLVPGCASYRPAPLSAAKNAAAIETRTLADARLQKFISAELPTSEPSPTWDLSRLTLAALYYHPDLDVARAGLASARARAVTAGQRPNPTLSLAAVLGTSAAAGAIPAGAAPVMIGPVINFIIETFDKRAYRTAQAQHLVAAARWDLATAGWQIRAGVRNALFDLWAARRRLALLRRRLALQNQLVSLLESRFAAGAASSLDVARERIRGAQLALAARDLDSARADALARLATAVGIPLAALDAVSLSFDAFDRPAAILGPTGELRRQALTRRTDVAAALEEYAATQSALQLAVAKQYPDLTLGSGYEYDFGLDKYLLGPSLVLPIFNQNQGPIAEAAAARRRSAASFTALQARIIGTIDRAGAAYAAASGAVATADSLLLDARQREDETRRSFAAGELDRPTLITAELEAAAAEQSRFEAVARQRRALGDLEDALQHPLFEPEARFLVPEKSPRPDAPPRL